MCIVPIIIRRRVTDTKHWDNKQV